MSNESAPTKMTRQVKRVYEYLKTHGSIEPLAAWQSCGVYRLSAVIFILRNEFALDIETKRVKVFNQYNESCNVALYCYRFTKYEAAT